MKRGLIVFVLFLIVLSFLAVADKDQEKVNPDVKKSLEKNDSVRVYVEYSQSENFGRRSLGSASIVPRNKVRHDFGSIVSAELSLEEITDLERDFRVESVELVGFRELQLSDAVPIMNGSNSFALLDSGLNLTGLNIGVCVLDSGINYTHPDLGGCNQSSFLDGSCGKVPLGYDFVNSDSNPYDDNGHGTHVSGIVAANGSLTGMAPGARIISMKVCNAAGNCADDDIAAGINACIGNATTYNISVISMSLGSGLYSGYCNSDPLADEINSAVGAGISVSISTGNGLNNDGNGNASFISAPACVQNATRVSSVTKSDAISSFANRNLITNLMGVGSSINSTCISAESSTQYCFKSGTSMSAPAISGALAVLYQYLNLTGQTKEPRDLEIVLNNTGKTIEDTQAGAVKNYSRINLRDAIIELDVFNPNVSLASPGNGTYSLNTNQSFSCSSEDLYLSNVTFFLWNSSSAVINETYETALGQQSNFSINISNLEADSYNWNCLYSDESGNRSIFEANYSLNIVDLTSTLISPVNNLYSKENQSYVCEGNSTSSLSNVTFFLWNSSGSLLEENNISISGESNRTTFSYNFSSEGEYYWNCLVSDSGDVEVFSSSNFTVNYDLTSPDLTINSPVNDSWQNSGNFNVSLSQNGSCSYSLDSGVNNESLLSPSGLYGLELNASNLTLVQGATYRVNYYCNDSAGNTNESSRLFRIDLTDPNVSISSPADNFSLQAQSLNFQYNVSDNLNISSCSVLLNNEIVASNSSEINLSSYNNISYSVSAGNYNWTVNCTDEAGNVGASDFRSLFVSAATSSSSGGGGGGGSSGGGSGGGSITPTSNIALSVNDSELNRGISRNLKEGDRLIFNIREENHTITVLNLEEFYALVSLESDPINLTLIKGSEFKLNLSSVKNYELYLKANNVSKSFLNLTIKRINETIESKYVEPLEEVGSEVEERSKGWIVIIVLIIILGLSYFSRNILNRDGKPKNL